MKANKIIIFFLFPLLVACNSISQIEMSASEYVNWFKENQDQFVVVKTIDKLDYIITYLPQEYLAAKQIIKGNNEHIVVDTNILTFNIRIQAKMGNVQDYSIQSFNQKQVVDDYLAYKVSNDISLLFDNSKYKAVHTIYHSGEGLTPYIDFLINFDVKHPNTDFQIQYNDFIWGSGRLNWYIEINKINNRPKLKI